MKKKMLAILALTMSVIIGVSSLFGCNLITADNERDLKQVVATVDIGNEGQGAREIYKSDMVMTYLNEYYSSVYNGEMTAATAFNNAIDTLVNTRIISQYIMQYCENKPELIVNSAKPKWDVERYLSADDIQEATYLAMKTVNELIDTYEENDDKYFSDASADTTRAVPTNAANADKDKNVNKPEYILNGIDVGGDDNLVRKKAYYEVLEVLDTNLLLGDFDGRDLTTSKYYKETLESQEEQLLFEKYDEIIAGEARSQITFETLTAKYEEIYLEQKEKNTNGSAIKTALDNANASSPILYAGIGGYGYVYNLLIGVSEDQKSAIEAIETTDVNARAQERRVILNSTKARDLRATWVTAGYDFDFTSKQFTGDYAVAGANSYPFQGSASIENADKDNEFRYANADVIFTLDEFIAEINAYLYDGVTVTEQDTTSASVYNPSVYYKAKASQRPADYEEKVNELLFAFSTDDGSLNTYMGYVVEPEVVLDGAETYMIEFARAGRELLDMGEGYIVAATDYGYHFMFYSKLIDESVNYPTLFDYLNSFGTVKTAAEWEDRYDEIMAMWNDEDAIAALKGADLYIYNLISAIVDTNTVNKNVESVANQYRYDEEYVKKYADRYADLLSM